MLGITDIGAETASVFFNFDFRSVFRPKQGDHDVPGFMIGRVAKIFRRWFVRL